MSQAPLPDLGRVSRLLIIRLGAIGDVVHALPLASALKGAFPNLEITWLVEEIPAEMVLGNPDLHDVIVVPRSRWKRGRLNSPLVWREYLAFLSGIRRRRFDLTIDLQGYGKTALYALAAGARYRFGWWRLRDGANLVSQSIPRRPESLHRVDYFLDVGRAFGITSPNVRFPIHIPQSARDRVSKLLLDQGLAPGSRYIVINQAAGNPPRRWQPERYAELAAILAITHALPSVLIGTAPERADCETIVRHVQARLAEAGNSEVPPPINLAGETNLKELAALLESCLFHVSGDTGSTHIAAALGTPVLAFYGATDPDHAGPWGQMDRVIAHRELCSPACTSRVCALTNLAQRAASYSSPQELESVRGCCEPGAVCLAAISVDEAMQRAEQLIAELRETGR